MKCLPPRWFFGVPNRWKLLGPSPDRKADVQEVPTVVLEFPSGLLGLYGVWHCHDEAIGLNVFCKLNHKASTELAL
jgi:hypothetical protein